MKIKKIDKADPEKHRGEGFLLGLIFALALVFTGLEYTTRPNRTDGTDNFLDDMIEDIDLMPVTDQKDMISALPSPPSPALTDKVKEVEGTVENIDRIAPATDLQRPGEDEEATQTTVTPEALPQMPTANEDQVMQQVEQLPEFPGGMVEFMKWLSRNLHYPTTAQQQKIEGKVVVTFIVNKDGTIANPKVDKSVHALLDNEALRVIRMMPKWKPGMIADKPCRTMFAIPVVFKI